METQSCSICARKLAIEKSHFCPICNRRSHAKCNGIETKFVKNVWLCKLCRNDALPNLNSDEELPIGKDISYLKSYFEHLNSISDTFSNFDSQKDDQISEYDYNDRVINFN